MIRSTTVDLTFRHTFDLKSVAIGACEGEFFNGAITGKAHHVDGDADIDALLLEGSQR